MANDGAIFTQKEREEDIKEPPSVNNHREQHNTKMPSFIYKSPFRRTSLDNQENSNAD